MNNRYKITSWKKIGSKLFKFPAILAVIFLSILVAGCQASSGETSKNIEEGTKDQGKPVASEEPVEGTIAITNVRVFEGNELSELKTIVIEDGLISSHTSGETVVDGNGGTLLPGFIDSHIHLSEEIGEEELERMAELGITTVLDMGTAPETINNLRELPDLPEIFASMGQTALGDIEMLDDQLALGADHIKIFLEDGPEAPSFQGIVDVVEAAHNNDKLVVAHVTSTENIQLAIDADVDILTHTPFTPLPESLIEEMVENDVILIPTIGMMKGVKGVVMPDDPSIEHVLTTVLNAHNAGVPVVVGTDSNTLAPGSPAPFGVEHGTGFHDELELMVEAGLTPLEVIQGATTLPSQIFNFEDRGLIEVGRRADLVLVDGDPTVDIKAARAIKGVWIKGVQVK